MTSAFEPWPPEAVHVEWGPIGARLAAERGHAVIVVDVLSFSTTLTVAAERGIDTWVYSGPELQRLGGAEAVARSLRATSTVSRRRSGAADLSLSPAALLAAPPMRAALFTSLNGAHAVSAADSCPWLAVGCLRNRSAVARLAAAWLRESPDRRLTVVACGERWSSVSSQEGLRPALEDWIGAGAIVGGLLQVGVSASPEAHAAAAAFAAFDLGGFPRLVSARELIATGYADDVELAVSVDVTRRVPVRWRAGRRRFVPADT